jgi:hypothetical protein
VTGYRIGAPFATPTSTIASTIPRLSSSFLHVQKGAMGSVVAVDALGREPRDFPMSIIQRTNIRILHTDVVYADDSKALSSNLDHYSVPLDCKGFGQT